MLPHQASEHAEDSYSVNSFIARHDLHVQEQMLGDWFSDRSRTEQAENMSPAIYLSVMLNTYTCEFLFR